ncbi:hypothetical protein LTR17_027434 [Elasticomyces elasticus]|nr:hypothetical protein LTR17_027434 [Elasticomyces elasticus]
MATPSRPRPASRSTFHIAIICALLEERLAVEALMTRHFKSEGHTYGIADGDENSYTLGEFGGKAVVLVAPRDMGITNTGDLAHGMRNSFKNISYAFVVGITGGAPFTYDERKNEWQQSHIHLGDVIVSTHVIDSGFGKEHDNFFETRSEIQHVLSRATARVANFVNSLKDGETLDRVIRGMKAKFDESPKLQIDKYVHPGPDRDHVYASDHRHKHHEPTTCSICARCTDWYGDVCLEARQATCQELGCRPIYSNPVRPTKIHFGTYASGNAVMKSARRRDKLIRDDHIIGFEMEGAGAWEILPTIVVKGVVDYADGHKNKLWREYPAAQAALCAAALVQEVELPDHSRTG